MTGCPCLRHRINANKMILYKLYSITTCSSSEVKYVGLDLGTTNSVCATLINGQPQVIPNAENQRTTPSVVHYGLDKELKVGVSAKRQASVHPLNTFFSFKRFMGRKYSELTDSARKVPYRLIKKNGRVYVQSTHLNRDISPEELSAQVLKKIVNDAEVRMETKFGKAVITVPAYFNDAQRQATKDAGRIAGLNVTRIVNEPTAACLAYGFNKLAKDKYTSEQVLVFDLGGGTFDVSVLDYGDGVFEVEATSGNGALGGDDFNFRVFNWLKENFEQENPTFLVREHPTAMQRLTDASELAKIELSIKESTKIYLPFLINNAHLNVEMTREMFDMLSQDLVDCCRQPVKNCLSDAKLGVQNIDRTILVGGSTRIPAIKSLIDELMETKAGEKIDANLVNVDEAVALGAAIQSGILSGNVSDMLLIDVTPLTLGVEVEGGLISPVVKRNTTLPVEKYEYYTTAADYMDKVTIKIFQGERTFSRDNKLLGEFDLTGIPRLKRGGPKIEVTFEIDVNGILTVRANEKSTGISQKIIIKEATTLEESEIARIIADAEKNSMADMAKATKIKIQLEGDFFLRKIQERLEKASEFALSEEKISTQRALVKDLKSALSSESITKIEELTQKVKNLLIIKNSEVNPQVDLDADTIDITKITDEDKDFQ